MLKRLHYISVQLPTLLLALACGLVTCGCSSDTDEPQPGPDPAREVVGTLGLYLNIDGPASTSRTPADGPYGSDSYDSGSGYENYIDINGSDVRIYIYIPGAATEENYPDNDRFYKEIKDFTIIPYSYDEISRFYYLTFPVDAEFKEKFEGQEFKIVLLANWHGKYPIVAENSPISSLVGHENAIMEMRPFGPAVASDNLIPLFGVKRFQLDELVPNMVKWLGDLSLLRAMAKIEVYDAESSAMPIQKITLTRHNVYVNKAPKNVTEEEHYVTKHYGSDYGAYNTFNDAENHESINVIKLKKADDGHYVIYVSEYRNLKFNDKVTQPRDSIERMRLKIDYGGGRDPKYVDFKYYTGNSLPSNASVGDYFNVRRNYWYKFEISKEREIEVKVIPYAEKELKPVFGLDIKNPKTDSNE